MWPGAFALAIPIMITLHELAHAVAALSFGLHPVLRAGSVDTGGVTAAQNVTTAAAGPVFSLISGLLVPALPRRGTPFVRLFVMWFGLSGVQEFNGYLMTGPSYPAATSGSCCARAVHRCGSASSASSPGCWVTVERPADLLESRCGRHRAVPVLRRFFMRRLDVPGEGPRFGWPWVGIVLVVVVAVLRPVLLGGPPLGRPDPLSGG